MKKFVVLSLLLISTLFAGSKPAVFADSNTSNTKTEVLTFVENQNQHNIGNLKSFAVNNNSVYLSNDSFSVFNKTTKTNTILNYPNVTEIKQTENYIIFKSNDSLKILKNNNEVLVENLSNITCDKFNAYEKNNNLYVSYTVNKTLNIVKIENNTIVDKHNTTINSDSSFAAICLNDAYTYAVLKTNSNFSFVKFNNQTVTQTALTFSYPNCSGLELLETETETYFVLTAYLNQTLIILKEDNTDLVTACKKDILGINGPSVALGELASIADVKTYKGLIYVADTTSKAIQSFKINETVLEPVAIEMASASIENGYFNSANDFKLVNDNTILIADTKNNRLQKIVDNNITVIDKFSGNTIEKPLFYTTNNNVDFYYHYDEYLVRYNDTTTERITIGSDVSDLKIDEKENIYFVDYANCTLEVIKAGSKLPEIIINNLNIDNLSNLELLNNNTAAIHYNTVIYLIDLTQTQIIQTLNLNENIKSITSDYYNNLYALTNSGIIKVKNTNNTLTIGEILSYNTANLTQIEINKINGSIYAYNKVNNNIIKITNETFVNNLANFEHFVTTENYQPCSTIVTTGTVNTNCYISDYPYNTNPSTKLLNNTNVFVMGEVGNSYYIMYNSNNTIKYGYILKSNLTILNKEINTPTTVIVINKNTKLYKLPTFLCDSNDLNFCYASTQLHEQLDAVNLELSTIDNSQYYAVRYDNKILYVNASDVTLYETDEIKSLPDLNAEIITTENKVVHLLSAPTDKSLSVLELSNNQKVYIENFDASKKYTYVTVVTEDKKQIAGYVETKHIRLIQNNPNMTSAYILLGVSILIAIASVVVYVKYKKSNSN